MSIKIITHSGKIHADELVAAAVVCEYIYSESDQELENGEIAIVRTRDPEKTSAIDEHTYIIDVGGVHCPAERQFDHHQNGDITVEDRSSAGLVWDQYGGFICDQYEVSDSQDLFNRINGVLIADIDAIDTGNEVRRPGGLGQSLATLVATFNSGLMTEDDAFVYLLSIVRMTLKHVIAQALKYVQSVDTVKNAPSCFQHGGKGYIILDEPCPWQEHLQKRPDYDDLLYVVFESRPGEWHCQAIPVKPGEFELRRPIADDVEHLKGTTFLHSNRFLAGANDIKSARLIAELSIRLTTSARTGFYNEE